MYDCRQLYSIGFERTRIAWEWYCVKWDQRAWCEQNGIAVSTFHYRQQKVWDALQERNQFVEVPLQVNEYRNENIAATVHIGEIRADIHNGADEATLTALIHALKSC